MVVNLKRFRRIASRAAAALALLAAVAALAGFIVIRSDRFREYVRLRVLAELERSTGGRAEIAQFTFDWRGLTAHVSHLVLHGKEAADQVPFLKIDSASVGLRVLSVLERRVDVASVEVRQPRIHIEIYPDGSTNLPGAAARGLSWPEELLNLKVRRYSITDAQLEIDGRKLPFSAQGQNLTARLVYDPRGPAYDGTVSAGKIRLTAPGAAPLETSFDSTLRLEKSRIWFPRLDLAWGDSQARLQGSIVDLRSPHGSFDMSAEVAVADALTYFRLPVAPQGIVRYSGTLAVDAGSKRNFALDGRVAASGLAYSRDRLNLRDASFTAAVRADAEGATLRGVSAQALGARISGDAQVPAWKRFTMKGRVEGLGLHQAALILTPEPLPWTATLSGEFDVDTPLDGSGAVARLALDLAPAPGGIPLEGHVQADYDRVMNVVALGPSWAATPRSRADISGTLNGMLSVRVHSTNLDDALPVLALARSGAPAQLPLQLRNGSFSAEGTLAGPLRNPRFAGQVSVSNGVFDGHAFDTFSGQLEAASTQIRGSRLTLARGATEITGAASLSAPDGRLDHGALAATLNARNVSIPELLREAGIKATASGTASATVRLSGTADQPQAEIVADVSSPQAYGERFSRLQTTVRYRNSLLEVTSGDLFDGNSSIRFRGSYKPVSGAWETGEITFDAAAKDLPATRFEHLAAVRPAVEAVLTGRIRGAGKLDHGDFIPSRVSSDLAVDRIRTAGEDIGNLALAMDTREAQLQVHATGRLRESAIDLTGSWRMQGDYPGSATLRFSRLSIDSLHDLIMLNGTAEQRAAAVPFQGFVEGGARITLALLNPREFTAEVDVDTFQMNAKPNQALRLGVKPEDIVLRNNRAVVVDVNAQEARLRQASFTGRDTGIEASGSIPLSGSGDADFALRGNLNLVLLQLLNPDLTARGSATVQASIRGNVRDPSVNGRLNLNGASLYFSDLPNGLDNASGSVLFDRKRATIERLTAESGGGTLSLSGFLEFGDALVYRLQANAQQVRVRYPEDLSTTFNAQLALNGTSESSTLSGVITLNRAAFNPRTDLGQLLAQSSKPLPAPASPNELLRGVQFDVRVESGPNFQFETSLTRNVEAEVDLHLRGSPLRPIVLGNISVNQGEVQVFGTRYNIDRGDVRFLNPAKIEPTVDMDLETRARGVTVNVSFSGTVQKLKVNYSSDPPLQPSEIIALLTVGRDPASTQAGGQAAASSASSSAFVGAGSGLISEALSAQVSSRLERFFGAGRVKIDPTLTGVDNLPQARLTLEQQVSRDVTLTYITNLNRTQEQIVRLQWDFNRNWSAVAVRDQNGLFGIDFQYRKRF